MSSAGGHGRSCVLIIEGDDSLCALLCLALSEEGLAIERAASATEGLSAVDHLRPDAVILAIGLPDLSGWEVLRRIRETNDVPVMIMSARDSEVDKARGLDLGADDYITKPFGLLEFEARVRALLRRARPGTGRRRSALTPEPERLGLTIAIIAEDRHLHDRALLEARAALHAAGCSVEVVVPDAQQPYEARSGVRPWDAVLSRGRDLLGLALLSVASALGSIAVNTPESIELVRNKIAMHAVLAKHGLPLPKTWFASTADAFHELPSECFPLIVKPFDGDGGDGLALLECREDTRLLPQPNGRRSLYLAQEFVETDGFDLKLYGIGSQVWAVRKPSPVSFPNPGPAVMRSGESAKLVPIDARLRDIALTCGRACGLELWGVDVAMTPSGPRILEVNDFPTYSAVPGAGAAIARHTLILLQSRRLARQAGPGRVLSMVRNLG